MGSYKGDLYKLLLVYVMAAPVISISSDVSVESVGSYFQRVILIGSISVEIPVAPEVRRLQLPHLPGVDIPIGRLYRTHTGGPCRPRTTRKSVRPLPSYRLALSLGHSLSEHASPDTTVVDSSTPLRFVHPPLARTSRCSEAYLHWRSAPLSTMYLPTTSESSAMDSSSEL
nr:hypothetical protein [Tanacetum cinerariifolium]